MQAPRKQEQQHVAVAPGNAHFISIRQVSSDAATARVVTVVWPAAAAAVLLSADDVYTVFGNLLIKN